MLDERTFEFLSNSKILQFQNSVSSLLNGQKNIGKLRENEICEELKQPTLHLLCMKIYI